MAGIRVVCMFDREQDIVGAAAAARERGLAIVDAYTPYPVHGLAAALRLEPSRLPWLCFWLGILSGAGMLLFQYWASAIDWPTNVGGRPWNSFPAFVPITFELVVLVAGVGTVVAFLAVAGLRPWRTAELPDPRVTDDRFALVLIADDAHQRRTIDTLMAHFRPTSIEDRST